MGTIFKLLLQVAIQLGAFCVYISKRLLARDAGKAMDSDSRSPVVFLRSFRDDGKYNFGGTFEESLARVLGKLGPVIAIGKPGERLPETGASRVYVGDDRWQEVASRMIKDARLIVPQAGTTSGITWELCHVRKHADPLRIILLVPFTSSRKRDRELYTQFRSIVFECLHTWLPISPNDVRFFAFDRTWQPIALAKRPAIPSLQLYTEGYSLRSELASLLTSPPPMPATGSDAGLRELLAELSSNPKQAAESS